MPKEDIVLEGQIITTQTLNTVLDTILDMGGDFIVQEMSIGKGPADASRAEIEVHAPDEKTLSAIMSKITRQGARYVAPQEVVTEVVRRTGTFPTDFYSTTNLETEIYYKKTWIPVENIEMDCGIKVLPDEMQAVCVPIAETAAGDHIVTGSRGIRVKPLVPERKKEVFSFMSSAVSSEKPKHLLIKQIVDTMRHIRYEQKPPGKIIFVCGPALVHTGASEKFCTLIENGFVQRIFAGNALATHDIEAAIFGTSLGISLSNGVPMEGGHRNHLRAINHVRRAGSIKDAIEQGIVTRGIMYTAYKHDVDLVLAGSIRDDGPMPEVITDAVEAQREMRRQARDAAMVVMMATTLHSIATGNLLPARVPTICVDINHAVVTKLIDRGSAQAIGIVTDIEPFVRELADAL